MKALHSQDSLLLGVSLAYRSDTAGGLMTKLIEHSSEMAAKKSSRLQVQKTRIGWGKNHWQSRASTARARCLEHASRNFAWTTRRFRRPRGEVPARQRHRAEKHA